MKRGAEFVDERWTSAEDGKVVRGTVEGVDRVVALVTLPDASIVAEAHAAARVRRAERAKLMATAPKLAEFVELVRDSFSASGEFNAHTAEVSLAELRAKAVKLVGPGEFDDEDESSCDPTGGGE